MTDSSPAPDAPIDPAVEAALAASTEARMESLLEIARIPSVSSLHEHAPDMVATAEWIADRLRRVGATEVDVIRTDLHPIVYGRIHEAPGAPTVLVYCHYDVQPVDPLDLWEHPPFEPFVRDGRVIGRGVADDKGQLVMHLGAIEALRAVGRAPAVNITFVFEGEEEYGSESLEKWIAEHGDRLEADAVIISDTGFFEGNVPAITVGLRGPDVRADRRRALAGRPAFRGYGGAVGNPANALATIIASLKGSDGRVRIPGFYDDVVPLTPCRAGGDRRPPVRRRGVPGRDPRAGARRRGRAGRRSSARARARRSTSTACGAASRARVRRPSSRPTRTRRSRPAWSPNQDPRRSSRRSATTSRRWLRPASP